MTIGNQNISTPWEFVLAVEYVDSGVKIANLTAGIVAVIDTIYPNRKKGIELARRVIGSLEKEQEIIKNS